MIKETGEMCIEVFSIKPKLSEEYTLWLCRRRENSVYGEEDSFSNNAHTTVNKHVNIGV
jgi:hypothetical protein